jgi:3-hydroxybutyryl-CoA dehydrogenase
MTIEKVGVVGCGLMGSGLAEVAAKAGTNVVVFEVDDDAVARGILNLDRSLGRAVKTGKLDEAARDEIMTRISVTTDLEQLADRELVIEAATENEAAKTEIFRSLDKVVTSPDAILASNTSSIPIMKLAMATSRPEKVIGLHFFNPVPVLRLVEIVRSLLTDDTTAERSRSFVTEQLGKLAIESQDRAGFIVNALLIPYQLAAIRMFESGFATAEDIDTGVVEGLAHPMGPLRLADLIGLDTVLAVSESLYAEFKRTDYGPPPLLSRMVDAGLLGRKTGRGFYVYDH